MAFPPIFFFPHYGEISGFIIDEQLPSVKQYMAAKTL